MPEISIIIPCYNQAHWLHEAIESVRAQTYANWECIIVNDGSVDNTETVARNLVNADSRIKYLSQSNLGLAGARNSGIRKAEGKYILPLDADDKISSDYLALAITIFNETPECKLVYGGVEFFEEASGIWQLPVYSYRNLLKDNCIYCSSIFKKELWALCGGYDESLKDGLEDWDFYLSVLDETSIVRFINSTVFYYRIRDNSMLRLLGENKVLLSRAQHYIRNKHLAKYVDTFGHPFDLMSQIEILEREKASWINSKRYKVGRNLGEYINRKIKKGLF